MTLRFRILLFLLVLLLTAQTLLSNSNRSLEWLPSGSYWRTNIFDPASPQISASLLAYQVKGSIKEKVYSPVNIGTQKMVFRLENGASKGLEFGLEFGLHSQFTIVDSGEAYMGGLQNTDYRIGGILHYRDDRAVWRLLLFHQSSHLGDDFMLRTQFYIPNSKTLNYEQLSLTRMHFITKGQYYYGMGFNVSPHTTRKRTAFHGGYQQIHPAPSNERISYLFGIHVRVDEQNDYKPNFKTGVGIQLGSNTDNPFMILLEYYKGNLPYSTLEYQHVQLFGLGVYFHL